MSTAMSKAESNALVVSYDVLGTHVELDLDFVKKYLVRGKAELVSNQELVFFMNTCRQQKLNPLVQGEVYLIKYSKDDPAQMVVGKDAYLRRAFDHPDYLFKNDGITVQRGNEIIQKEGCCLYPGETLVGGWCRVTFMRNGKERTAFKEVAFAEYNKGQANWKSKPATMINKVAVSQCVRDAFPKDYEGVYSEDEMVASGAIPVDYNRKAVKDKRLHNTKLLLQNYHCFVEHSKSAVYEASQLSEDDDFEELMEELMSQSDGRVRVPVVRSIQESAAHTRIIVQHIDRMLEYYKFRCEHSKRAEEMRRYRTIYDLYIAPEPKTQQQIADEEHVDLSTVFRDQKAGISKLSALIFGWLD